MSLTIILQEWRIGRLRGRRAVASERAKFHHAEWRRLSVEADRIDAMRSPLAWGHKQHAANWNEHYHTYWLKRVEALDAQIATMKKEFRTSSVK